MKKNEIFCEMMKTKRDALVLSNNVGDLNAYVCLRKKKVEKNNEPVVCEAQKITEIREREKKNKNFPSFFQIFQISQPKFEVRNPNTRWR